jgi:hypothetical protein
MKSLTTLLERVGLSDSIYEIFVDATEDVLSRTQAAIQNGAQDESFLVEALMRVTALMLSLPTSE